MSTRKETTRRESSRQRGRRARAQLVANGSVEDSGNENGNASVNSISIRASTPVITRPLASTSAAVSSAFPPVNLFTNTTAMNKTVKDVAVGASERSSSGSCRSYGNSRRQRKIELEIAAEKRKLVLDAEEAQLQLKILATKRAREDTINKKLQDLVDCERSDDEDSKCDEQIAKSKSNVQEWINRLEHPPKNVNEVATTSAVPMPAVNNTDVVKNFLARQTVTCKLPSFSGNSQEWPMFIAQYESTTKLCGLGPHENMVRLQEALKGKAREAVESIMGFPENVDMVIETLKLSFGRDDQVIKALMNKAKLTPAPKEGKPESIITFYNAVNNMVCTMQRLNCTGHLNNPCLLEEFVQKMSPQLKSHWAFHAFDQSGESNLQSYVLWLKRWASAQSLLPSYEIPVQEKHKKPSNVMQVVEEECTDAEDEVKTTKKLDLCLFCKKPKHVTTRCRNFKSASVNERWKFAKEKKCCFLCLRQGHTTSNCKSTIKCSVEGCEKKHHGLLHNPENKLKLPQEAVMTTIGTSEVLLKIIPITLKSQAGEINTYALLDDGSTVTMLDEKIANELKLEGANINFAFRGINATTTQSKSRLVNFMVTSTSNKTFQLKNVKTVPNLSLPAQSLRMGKKKWSHLKDIDICTYTNAVPTILIGQDHVDLIIAREIRQGPPNAPVASLTKLGWVLHGNSCNSISTIDTVLVNNQCFVNDELHELVKSYFKLEGLDVHRSYETAKSREDKMALDIMEKSSSRDGERWMTGLLWRDANVKFPESRSQAERRLRHVEKKMDRDPIFSKAYCAKIQDHIDKGYVRELSLVESVAENPKTLFLPHFAVVNPNKPGKIRVVWDAAAKSGGKSLNSELLTGPDLYNSLPGVLFKFRQRAVAISADIQEMFLQIKILPDDCQAQRFLWRGEDRKQKPKVYELVVMIFGSVCSPSQAQYIKNRNALEMESEFPKAVEAIIKRHYMDDYLDSMDTVAEAEQQIRDVIHVHKSGGFNIRNWISSHPKIFDAINPELVADGMKTIEADNENKYAVERVLGLRWNPNDDSFNFEVKFHKVAPEVLTMDRRPTKREVLKVIMSIFDPLGFVSHFHVKAKILLQDIWKSGIGWDDEIANDQYSKWTVWLQELKMLPNLKIPRWYGFPSGSTFELHQFCDASSSAYASVAYLRCELPASVEVTFIMSKTRVAPLKPMTIPRLELMAALMGSKMADFIKHYHDLNIGTTYLWTDSQTVLRWIRSDANRYKTFVAQRLGEIDELTDVSQWKWVPSKENVADEATRCEDEVNLKFATRWFTGPDFLKLKREFWPKEKEPKYSINTDAVAEVLEFVNLATPVKFSLPDATRFSSLTKLLRSTAWLLRYVSRCKGKIYDTKELSTAEIDAAEKIWWKSVQWDYFQKDMVVLTNGKEVASTSSLRTLCPKLDKEGIMRLSTRCKLATDLNEQVLLDRNHAFTVLLVKHYHYIHKHIGRETVANEIRQKYWIPALRQLVQKVYHNCNVCKIMNARPTNPKMGLLPAERLTPYVKPFHFTGMDYFGPLEVRVGRKREKRYGVIFSCFTTRAIHLEVATNLTTDSAIMAVRRLVSLRGKVNTIWSDNGRNLVGANNELKLLLRKMDQNEMSRLMTSTDITKGIIWKFNPPASPHMGGSWERLIQSVKRALRAVFKAQVLKPEVLQTVFAEIAHSINSRPLTHVSVDPNDPESITPNHLLCGMNTEIIQQMDLSKMDLRRQWILSQEYADKFWKRWIKEYRPTLLKRSKWFKTGKNIEINDIVIIVDDSFPRNFWPLGRIVDVHPGSDGAVRVVDVKTATGTYRRPVSKLCLLDVRN